MQISRILDGCNVWVIAVKSCSLFCFHVSFGSRQPSATECEYPHHWPNLSCDFSFCHLAPREHTRTPLLIWGAWTVLWSKQTSDWETTGNILIKTTLIWPFNCHQACGRRMELGDLIFKNIWSRFLAVPSSPYSSVTDSVIPSRLSHSMIQLWFNPR